MYGYQKFGRKRETRLEIVPEEAEVIRNIFTWYTIEGLKGQAIADRINAQGLMTPAKAKNIIGNTDELTRDLGYLHDLRHSQGRDIFRCLLCISLAA